MSHTNLTDGPRSPAEILEAASELDGNDNRTDADTSTEPGRAAVREFVDRLESGETARVRARRILVEIGAETPVSISPTAGRVFERADGVADTQCIGRTLAAMSRGVTPDDFLPHVDVSKWDETTRGGPTTWQIEVGRDA